MEQTDRGELDDNTQLFLRSFSTCCDRQIGEARHQPLLDVFPFHTHLPDFLPLFCFSTNSEPHEKSAWYSVKGKTNT